MARINQGTFKGDTYHKKVNFSKAVLWKDRQISLSPTITKQFKPKGIKTIIFEDPKKHEQWIVDYDTAKENAILKKEGQEPQFYLPIEIFTKKSTTKHDFAADVEWFDKLIDNK